MKNSLKKLIVTILIVAIALSCSGCISGRIYGKPLDGATALNVSQGGLYLEQIVLYMNEDNKAGIESLAYHHGKEDAPSFDGFWESWENVREVYGTVKDHGLTESYNYGDEPAFVAELLMENDEKLMFQMRFSEKFELYELYMYEPAESFFEKVALPENVEEIDITVVTGGYELPGKITMPKGAAVWNGTSWTSGNAQGLSAAVLVSADGANDMDLTAGNSYFYRDLAWELAEQGVVTIRYDKRTYTYQDEALDENADRSVFTVNWEYTDDANSAAKMLSKIPCVDAEKIYYIGHSQGGQVGSRADQESGGLYAGFVLINSSPRGWYDVIYDQYINYGLCDRSSEEIYYLVSKIKTEREFIEKGDCARLKEEELTQDFILTRAAGFWVDYMSCDYVGLYKQLQKPMLILQGGSDYQVVSDKDFVAWQDELAGCSFVTFKEFEDLNHLMMPSEGIFFGHYKEYDIPHTLGDGVAESIAEFVK